LRRTRSSSASKVCCSASLRPATAAPVRRIGLGQQQTALAQAFDQARELRLVAPTVLGQIALRGAGMAAKKAQHLALHMRDVMRAVAQHAVLLRADLMHQRMHGLQHIILGALTRMVDSINLFSHNE
jgi:hypothetical protein